MQTLAPFCGSGPFGETGDKKQGQRHGSGHRQGLGNRAVCQQLSTTACPEAHGTVLRLKGCGSAPPWASLEPQGSRHAFPARLHTGIWGRLLLKAGRDVAGSGCLSKLVGITAR